MTATLKGGPIGPEPTCHHSEPSCVTTNAPPPCRLLKIFGDLFHMTSKKCSHENLAVFFYVKVISNLRGRVMLKLAQEILRKLWLMASRTNKR